MNRIRKNITLIFFAPFKLVSIHQNLCSPFVWAWPMQMVTRTCSSTRLQRPEELNALTIELLQCQREKISRCLCKTTLEIFMQTFSNINGKEKEKQLPLWNTHGMLVLKTM